MFNQNVTIAGLNSYSVAVPAAGVYFLDGKVQIPTVSSGGGASGAVVTITNGTGPVTLYTGTAGKDGFKIDTVCAAGDVLTVALTSAASADQGLNAVKTVVAIGSGV